MSLVSLMRARIVNALEKQGPEIRISSPPNMDPDFGNTEICSERDAIRKGCESTCLFEMSYNALIKVSSVLREMGDVPA